MQSSGWVAVRCIFRSQVGHGEGEAVYEERVTLWQDLDVDRAIERAEEEALAYATGTAGPADGTSEYLGLAQAYSLFDEPADGAEVFSLLRTSDLSPTAYVDRFFDTGREHQRPAGGFDEPVARPRVVCLCGSLRFWSVFQSERERLTSLGVIVLGPEAIDGEPTPAERQALGELHLRRIDLADEVRVVSAGGHVGSSTRREVAYARSRGTVVTSVEETLDL